MEQFIFFILPIWIFSIIGFNIAAHRAILYDEDGNKMDLNNKRLIINIRLVLSIIFIVLLLINQNIIFLGILLLFVYLLSFVIYYFSYFYLNDDLTFNYMILGSSFRDSLIDYIKYGPISEEILDFIYILFSVLTENKKLEG